MSRRFRLLSVALLCVTASCGERTPPRPVRVTDDVLSAARSANAFAFDLYGRLRGREGNLFFSPAGVATALAMTSAGARGETERQIAAVLHADLPADRRHAAFGTLDAALNAGGRGDRLASANRLWGPTVTRSGRSSSTSPAPRTGRNSNRSTSATPTTPARRSTPGSPTARTTASPT